MEIAETANAEFLESDNMSKVDDARKMQEVMTLVSAPNDSGTTEDMGSVHDNDDREEFFEKEHLTKKKFHSENFFISR